MTTPFFSKKTPCSLVILMSGLMIFAAAILPRHTIIFGRIKAVWFRSQPIQDVYKRQLYLSEDEMPKQWYNLRADMKELPDPMINPGTMKPAAVDDLYPVFCEELAKQEMDNTTRYIDIPEEIQEMYKIYRPSPLIRAYNLEKALGTPAKIYYKFEGNNTSGSHKLNSAIAQAYYAKKQGMKGLTTETGAGQWGTALSEACSYFGIPLTVYMVKEMCIRDRW